MSSFVILLVRFYYILSVLVVTTLLYHYIEKIIEAIIDGFKSDSLKQKLSELEEQKENLVLDLQKKELIAPITNKINEDYLKTVFEKHKNNLSERNKEMIKNFIKLFVQEVVVYNEFVDVVYTISDYLVERVYGEPYHK